MMEKYLSYHFIKNHLVESPKIANLVNSHCQKYLSLLSLFSNSQNQFFKMQKNVKKVTFYDVTLWKQHR